MPRVEVLRSQCGQRSRTRGAPSKAHVSLRAILDNNLAVRRPEPALQRLSRACAPVERAQDKLDMLARAKRVRELIEVPSARWRDAVEGYLQTRRFDIIVAPEDYPRALGLYERHKRDYHLPGRGPVFISGAGLVDVERLLRMPLRPAARSLAEQVQTDDAYARAYCDFVLGEIICVDDEQSLRKHRAAITDTVMVYRNHVARQTARDVFSRHYIGQAAQQRCLEEIATRLGALHDLVVGAARHIGWLDQAVRVLDRARAETRRLPDLVERAKDLLWLEKQSKRLATQKERFDRKEFSALEQTRDELAARRHAAQQEKDRAHDDRVRAEERLANTQRGLEEAHGSREDAGAQIRAFADPLDQESREAYEQRYERERVARTPDQIRDVFSRQRRNIESRVQKLIESFVALKTRYVERRGLVATIEGSRFDEFATELEGWQESRLPSYEPLSVALAELERHAVTLATEPQPAWMRAFLQDLAESIRRADPSILGFSRPRLKHERRSLLPALTAAVALSRDPAPAWERVTSERLFGDSKLLGRVRPFVVAVLVRADPRWQGVPPEEAADLLEV